MVLLRENWARAALVIAVGSDCPVIQQLYRNRLTPAKHLWSCTSADSYPSNQETKKNSRMKKNRNTFKDSSIPILVYLLNRNPIWDTADSAF
ncbi:hypothetical protein XENTR_v10021861 [Xenopus tropicalis]|nr:hypothetical protein XENTR_v10021861 [Xenopus tropicalis]